MPILCKFLLPCGRCEKLGGPCDAKAQEVAIKDLIDSYETKKDNTVTNTYCLPGEHRWKAITESVYSTTYECEKCHTVITTTNGNYPW